MRGDRYLDREYVSSSNIRSIGYDATSETLEIEFNSGGIYQYFGVPEHVYDELMSAPSIGTYFHQNIKDCYRCTKVA
jgi:hypothetical protein